MPPLRLTSAAAADVGLLGFPVASPLPRARNTLDESVLARHDSRVKNERRAEVQSVSTRLAGA